MCSIFYFLIFAEPVKLPNCRELLGKNNIKYDTAACIPYKLFAQYLGAHGKGGGRLYLPTTNPTYRVTQ